jgi:hypothetical protein
MERHSLLAMVDVLGKALAERGLHRHVEELRVYWLALSRGLAGPGQRLNIGWSEALVVEWFRLLRLPPHAHDYPLCPPSSPCPRCPHAGGHAVEVKTALTFPEGRKAVCTVCGTAWLELDALHRGPEADARQS